MGCDIHMLIETADAEGRWTPLKAGFSDRNYRVFGLLANVRNGYGFAGIDTGDALQPLANPRGLPPDYPADDDGFAKIGWKDPYSEKNELWLGDHSHSWLLADEVTDPAWRSRTVVIRGLVQVADYEAWKKSGESFPTSWCGGTNRPMVTEADYLKLKREGEELRGTFAADLYIAAQWKLTAWWAVGQSFRDFVWELEELSKEYGAGRVRLVFGFDS